MSDIAPVDPRPALDREEEEEMPDTEPEPIPESEEPTVKMNPLWNEACSYCKGYPYPDDYPDPNCPLCRGVPF